jgi:uncharacterized membrane protein
MSRPDPRERARENASGIAALLVTGVWLSLMLAGFEYWLPLMLFGYVVVVPLVGILFDEEGEDEWIPDDVPGQQRDRTAADENADASDDEALARLRQRYADGELTDEQFERKVERLLETDTLENAEERHRDRRRDRERDRQREPEFE